MTESPWGRPYNQPFELEPHIEAWRIDTIDEQGETKYLRCIPNPGRWSHRARCHQRWPYHTYGPVPGCGCGYRIVRDIATLAEYWRIRRHTAFDPRLTTPGLGIAIVRVIAAGNAQSHDTDGNLNSANCLSVEFIRHAPGSTIYTPSAKYAADLAWRYRTDVTVIEDFTPDVIPEVPHPTLGAGSTF